MCALAFVAPEELRLQYSMRITFHTPLLHGGTVLVRTSVLRLLYEYQVPGSGTVVRSTRTSTKVFESVLYCIRVHYGTVPRAVYCTVPVRMYE